jgi:hypothetical protein
LFEDSSGDKDSGDEDNANEEEEESENVTPISFSDLVRQMEKNRLNERNNNGGIEIIFKSTAHCS